MQFNSINLKVKNRITISLVCILIFMGLRSTQILADEKGANLPPLTRSEGYLLIDLNIKAENATLICSPLRSPTKIVKIDLIPTQSHWLLRNLPAGKYQVLAITVPYFDLPYVKNTEKIDTWQFTIKEKRLNYFGLIKIEKERTENYVDIKRLNHLFTNFDTIGRDFKELTELYPLADSSGNRDDFSAEYFGDKDE